MQHWDNPLLVHRISGTDYTDTDKNGEASKPVEKKPLVWDWTLEHEDRKKEAKSDEARHGAGPFQVDRKLLKDIVREKMEAEVVRIQFLGAGEFTSEIYFWLNSLTLCFGASKAPSTRQVALLSDSRLTLFLLLSAGLSHHSCRRARGCRSSSATIHAPPQDRVRGGHYALSTRAHDHPGTDSVPL